MAHILTEFEGKLKQAGIFGAVGVSQIPYHFNCDVRRAFCELWGPLTITLHRGVVEIGISLYDIERISGLSVIGDVYEEFCLVMTFYVILPSIHLLLQNFYAFVLSSVTSTNAIMPLATGG